MLVKIERKGYEGYINYVFDKERIDNETATIKRAVIYNHSI